MQIHLEIPTDAPVILSAEIGPFPRPLPLGMFDEMPTVTAVFSNGVREKLFSYYPDEITFSEDEFVGLTKAQAMDMRHQRDSSFLRQRG